MSILKLGASLEGLLGLRGAMSWTVTQKQGAQGGKGFDFAKFVSGLSIFPKELLSGFLMTHD